jgi:hypothetical protein
MDQRNSAPDDFTPSSASRAPAQPPKASNRGALGCLLTLVLAFGGCTAYFVVDGMSKYGPAASSNTDGSGSGATSAAEPATSAPASPAQMLADLDGDVNPVSSYQAAVDALAPKCTQDEVHIAGLGDAGYKDLIKNGITDETRLSVLQHLSDSIPASLGKTDCTAMLSAYLVLREQG